MSCWEWEARETCWSPDDWRSATPSWNASNRSDAAGGPDDDLRTAHARPDNKRCAGAHRPVARATGRNDHARSAIAGSGNRQSDDGSRVGDQRQTGSGALPGRPGSVGRPGDRGLRCRGLNADRIDRDCRPHSVRCTAGGCASGGWAVRGKTGRDVCAIAPRRVQ